MESTILIRYGELFLKGKNKHYFERVLINNIREKIEVNPKDPRYLKVVWGVGYKVEKI